MEKINIGFIVDDLKVDKKNYELIKWIEKEKNLNLKCLVNQKIKVHKHNKYIYELRRFIRNFKVDGFSRYFLKLNEKLEYFFLGKKEKKWISYKYNPMAFFEKVVNIKPNISKSGFVYRYDDKSIEFLAQQKLDLIIRAGSGILLGNVLNIAKNGIISFHHADNLVNRGGPPGFWEVFKCSSESGFTIQKINEELDGGDVLSRGSFLSKGSWLRNKINVQRKANVYIKKILNFYIENKKLPQTIESKPYCYPLYKSPSTFKIIFYQVCVLKRYLKRFVNFLFKIDKRWTVYYQETNWKKLSMWRAKKINNPKGTFLADPFQILHKNKIYIFVEEYSFKQRKGYISAYLKEKNNIKRLGKVLDEKFHLSYPFLFHYEDSIYMIPECNQTKSIRLYKAYDFPMKWKFEREIMSNISASDTTLIKKDQTWWMFVNIDLSDNSDHSSELSIFYSDDPINGEWKPHKNNPLIVSPKKARMGGFIHEENQIYRVSQSQGFQNYGEKINIYEILDLTKDSYKENLITTLSPSFAKGIVATHHLNCQNNFTLFDAARYEKII